MFERRLHEHVLISSKPDLINSCCCTIWSFSLPGSSIFSHADPPSLGVIVWIQFLKTDRGCSPISYSLDRRGKQKSLQDEDQHDKPVKLEASLHKALSRVISQSSYVDQGPPPDGDPKAWTQALMGHLIVFNIWGYDNSFDVFQTYFGTTLHHPHLVCRFNADLSSFLHRHFLRPGH